MQPHGTTDTLGTHKADQALKTAQRAPIPGPEGEEDGACRLSDRPPPPQKTPSIEVELLDDSCRPGWALFGALALCDPALAIQGARGALLASALAEAAGTTWSRPNFWGALLRDVGQLEVPSALLDQPGPLEPGDRERIAVHPLRSAELLSAVPDLADAAPVALHHHERWDGTGQPDGLAGTEIPMPCRILAVADAFTALLANRPYRAALDPEAALDLLITHGGSQFDPALVEVLGGLLLVVPPELTNAPATSWLSRRVPAVGDRRDRASDLSGAQLEALFAAALGLEASEAARVFGRAAGTQRTWSSSLRRTLACPPRVSLDRFLALCGRDTFRALLPADRAPDELTQDRDR